MRHEIRTEIATPGDILPNGEEVFAVYGDHWEAAIHAQYLRNERADGETYNLRMAQGGRWLVVRTKIKPRLGGP